MRKWIIDWNLTTEKKHTLLRLVYEALVDCKKRYAHGCIRNRLIFDGFLFGPDLCGLYSYSEPAAKVMVELLGSYTEDNASQARVDAHRYAFCSSNTVDVCVCVYALHAPVSHIQVHCPRIKRPKHVSVWSSPGSEACPLPGGRAHPWCE